MTDLDQLTQSLARNLKHWRHERGYTLDSLAARAGVSRGMIIQIEQARTNPSVGTTVKLADALGVSITALLGEDQGPEVRIVAPGDAVRMWSTDAGSRSSLLVGADTPGPCELWDWRLMPGDSSEADPHPPGSMEMIHVRSGDLTLVVEGEEYAVPAGASACFEPKVVHGYRNDTEAPVEMTMAVVIQPTG